MSHDMRCLQVIGLKDDLLPIIQMIGKQGCMDVENASHMPGMAISALVPSPDLVRKQEALNREQFEVNSLIEMLGINDRTSNTTTPDTPPLEASALNRLSMTAQALVAQRDRLRAEQELLPRFLVTIRKLMPLFPEAARQPDWITFGLLIDRNHTEVLRILANHVSRITAETAHFVTVDVDTATSAMLIAAPGNHAETIGNVLDEQDVSRLRLPPGFETRSVEDAVAALNARIQAIPAECAALDRELDQLGAQWASQLKACRQSLENQLELYRILPLLGQTETTFVAVGWVPAREITGLQTALTHGCSGPVVVAEIALSEAQARDAPVILQNPAFARPFESLVNLFSTPHAQELDPTVLVAVFMPIFFGMMLGDIGYGALLLALVLWLRRRFSAGVARDIVNVLGIGAGWAIIFGLLYGELFGTLGENLHLHPLLFDRADSAHLLDLLALTVAAGAIHLTLSLLLGLWQGFKTRNRHHLLERGGRLLGLMALFLLVAVLADLLPDGFITPAFALLIVGTALLAASLGKIGILLGPIEMIGLVGNLLSYLRIAAIGLSSVYLALVAGEMVGVVGSAMVGVLIAVLLHALNLVLGAFSPTIQSLRLHYVEFFRNFYTGGGRLYTPFKLQYPSKNG